jgi:hypothetical protein
MQLSGRQQAVRTLLDKRFAKLFKERLVIGPLSLPEGLARSGKLVPARVDSGNEWLVLSWRRQTD